MSRPSNLPPILAHFTEDKITVRDPLTGRVATIDPRDKNLQNKHAALYGLWRAAYATAERTNHD